jgi:hypothetical protein
MTNHDKPSTLCGATVPAHSKELLEQVPALALAALNLEQLVGVVHIASGLEGHLTQATHGAECLVITALLHVPAGAFRAKVDLQHDDEGRDTGGAQHPAPLRVLAEKVGVLESDRDDESEADTESSPHL